MILFFAITFEKILGLIVKKLLVIVNSPDVGKSLLKF